MQNITVEQFEENLRECDNAASMRINPNGTMTVNQLIEELLKWQQKGFGDTDIMLYPDAYFRETDGMPTEPAYEVHGFVERVDHDCLLLLGGDIIEDCRSVFDRMKEDEL